MDKKFLKKIIAQSPEDLQIISACCSEAKVKISDIKYLPSNKIFLLSLLRIDRENQKNKNLIKSIIKFEFIESFQIIVWFARLFPVESLTSSVVDIVSIFKSPVAG